MLGRRWPRIGVRGGPVLAGILLLVIGLLGGGAAHAQQPAPAATAPLAMPEPLTREALRDLLAHLSDAQARELLLAEFDRQIATRSAAESDMMVSTVDAGATAVRERWRRMTAALPALPEVPALFAGRLIDGRGAGRPA